MGNLASPARSGGRIFFLLLLLVPLTLIYPLPPQSMIHPGHWSYDALAFLSREQGLVLHSGTRLTAAQMESLLSQIDPAALSDSGLQLYDRLVEHLDSQYWLNFSSDAIRGGMDLIIQPEGFYKTNPDVPWIFDDHSRSHLVQIPWGFSLGDVITAQMDMFVGENPYAATLHHNYGNIPLDPVPQADIHFPRRAYMSTGFNLGEASGFNFALGLGDNFFGRTHTGSIILSEHLERTIYAQAVLFSPAFRYTAEVLQYGVNKYQYMHYFQIRPHRRFSISLAEGVMVAAPLELRFLNPFTIFHSHESYKTYTDYNIDQGRNPQYWETLEDLWGPDFDRTYDPNYHSRVGSYLGIKLEFQPLNNLRLYGLFAMNQFNLPMKEAHWMDTLFPNGAGFQGGLEFSIPVAAGYWEFGLEGVYTYPYLYVLWDKSWSFYKEIPELDTMTLRHWTGSPFGPDTVAGALWGGFWSNQLWYGGLSFVFSAQGPRSSPGIFDIDTDINNTYRPHNRVYDVTSSPTGIPVYTFTARLRGTYQINSWSSVSFQPGYRQVINTGHEEGVRNHSFEAALSLRLQFPFN
ncbi:MAG: hypothetical protein FWH12_08325 [Treponema sp.]|nr:hypothetical protein [Treponema sp.]